MQHELVREAVTRIGVGEQSPAPSEVDVALAELAAEQLVRSQPEAGRRYIHSVTPAIYPDIRSAMQAVESERLSVSITSPTPIGGTTGDERDAAMTDARVMLQSLLMPEVDREVLALAQRFRLHTRAPYAGHWQHGAESWRLVSRDLPEAVALAVGLEIASVPRHDSISADVARKIAIALQLMLQAGIWAYRIDANGKVAMVPKPAVTLNAADEPHSRGEAAISWPDAQSVWAFNGHQVPRAWIVEPERITTERIESASSLPLAEVMLAIYGPGKYMQEHGQIASEDETGKLWYTLHPWQSSAQWGRIDVHMRLVEVINSSPEPDGSFKTYWLRVPTHTRSARGGVAWTFGMDERDYSPVVET